MLSVKYRIVNPLDNSETDYDTFEEARQASKYFVWDLFLQHTHNSPVSKVSVSDTGEEIWEPYVIENKIEILIQGEQ
jgi:hypothetical protein